MRKPRAMLLRCSDQHSPEALANLGRYEKRIYFAASAERGASSSASLV